MNIIISFLWVIAGIVYKILDEKFSMNEPFIVSPDFKMVEKISPMGIQPDVEIYAE